MTDALDCLALPLRCGDNPVIGHPVYNANGIVIARFDLAEQAKAIIRAVNSFEKMREALKPFAVNGEGRVGWTGSHQIGGSSITNDDLFRAAAVLKEIEDD